MLILTTYSCNTVEKSSEESQTEINQEERQRFFQIPAPTELFELLRSEGVKPTKVVTLNPVANIVKYSDSESKALNFGVYTTNLLFLSVFNQKSEVLKYFENLKQLAEDLGIDNVINESTMSRIEKNLNNADSLDVITNYVFFEASENLESQDKQDILSLVIAGSWIEGVFMAAKMIEKFSANSEIAQRIAEQKFSLENLLEYFEFASNRNSISKTKAQLEALMPLFNAIAEIDVNDQVAANSQTVIGSSTRLSITEDQFQKISAQIELIRNQITKN
ncbi:MAG: hypothetical protein ACK4GL_03450 [Flavobacteriales bacterium]